MEEKIQQTHNAIIENRNKFTLTGVKEVLSFDDETVMLDTALGKLAIKGANLHILSFDTDSSDLAGEGRIHALIYTAQESSGFFARLFR